MTLVALTGFATSDRVIPCGAHVDDDDPVVEGREHLFTRLPGSEPAKSRRGDRVEQATAAPGEVRNSRRGRPTRDSDDED